MGLREMQTLIFTFLFSVLLLRELMDMESIKERLQKIKCQHKERSKNLTQQHSDDKTSSSSAIQISSDSDGIKDTKMTTQSCGHPQPEEPIETEQRKRLKPWHSAVDVNSVQGRQHQTHLVSNTSTRAASLHTGQRNRAKSKTSRERTTSANSSSSSSNKIMVHDKSYTVLNILGKGGSSVVCYP